MTIIDSIGQRLQAHGVEVHDIRGALPRRGNYPRINPRAYQYTAVHYTAAPREPGSLNKETTSFRGHAGWHVQHNGWPGIAYAIGVSLSGRVFLLHEAEEMGYHAFDANASAFPVVADMADQEPTPALLRSLEAVLRVLHTETPEMPKLNVEGTYGHSELTFIDARNVTACPGLLLPYVQRYRNGGDFDGAVDTPADPAPATPDIVTFPTGVSMNKTYGFYRFWEANGGVPIFGYPITGEITEDGATVEYFERARFELAPDGAIRLGLVGSEAYATRYPAR